MDTPASPKKPSNRRSAMRKPARRSIRLQCRHGAMGLGVNVASSFLDISETGVQLLTKDALKLGEEVELLLEGYGIHGTIRRIGDVRWTVPLEGGGCRAGVRFQKFITFRDVQNLSNP
jgi:PilZ domain